MKKAERPVWMATEQERAGARKQFLKYSERVGTNPMFERLLIPLEVEQPEVEVEAEL
jgi:hypothetical protein